LNLIKDLYGLCHLRLKSIENELEYEKSQANKKIGTKVVVEAPKEKFSFDRINEPSRCSQKYELPPDSFLSRLNEEDISLNND
jgi:hypothetical protein